MYYRRKPREMDLPKSRSAMRCSSIPKSLILVASVALTFGACGVDQTLPGGAGATPPPTMGAAAGSTAAGAGMTGAAAAAGKTGTTTSPATGAAGGGTSTVTGASAGSKAPATASAGTTGAATGSAGTPATGGAAGAVAAGAAGGGAAGGGAAAGGAVTFTKVHEDVLTGAGCATPSCHSNAQGTSKLGFADKDDAYMGLVGVMAMGTAGPGSMTGGCMGMPVTRVKAGDPASSLLVQKLEAKQTCGAQMPPGGSIKPELIQEVKDWIMAGAKND